MPSSDLAKLFKPSVSLGPSKRLNSQNDRKLLNHCTSKSAYIRDRCQAIHGKSFNKARLMISDVRQKELRAQILLKDGHVVRHQTWPSPIRLDTNNRSPEEKSSRKQSRTHRRGTRTLVHVHRRRATRQARDQIQARLARMASSRAVQMQGAQAVQHLPFYKWESPVQNPRGDRKPRCIRREPRGCVAHGGII